MDLCTLTTQETAALLRNRTISSPELVREMLARIKKHQPKLNAYITVTAERAMQQAKAMQARLDSGEELHPLAGIPMALKDNLCTKGIRTTCGSKMLAQFIPPYTATAAQRLEDAGAILLGKLNMDEFAMGSSNENSYFGAVRNPYDPERVPGGSSGGAAAAVADGMAMYALGSDTGGSIRQPCSFCGISGIKPTYGAVSRYGLIAFASSLDQIGPMARTVDDCALILSAISGHDPRDSTSVNRNAFCFQHISCEKVENLTIGLPRTFFSTKLDNAFAAPILAAAQEFNRLGASVREVDLEIGDYAIAAYYTIACAEASANLGRYDGVRYGHRAQSVATLEEIYTLSRSEGFGAEVKRRILLGTFVLSAGHYDAFYRKAQMARQRICRAFADAFAQVDLLLTPCTPTTAFRLGEKLDDPLAMYQNDIYTVPVNLAGLPALSLPCGMANGLPVGMQLIGPAFSEPLLVRVGKAYQQSRS